ncbi:YraN family protein [Rhodococcus sp. X156]|uniref:YraN family protein n=1 Tax=Rhodococcus sp. X156 TaxID=2499145 RepID=UPI0019D2D23F|nr:YraN family protein [Rhodococcus sp. X156]
MPNPRAVLGAHGEDVASRYLTERGLVVLDRNWRCRQGELDLVAVDGQTLVVVEVKTRTGVAFGHPAESVTREKLLRLRRLAQLWLAAHRVGWVEVRFDVVSVLVRPGRPVEVEHFPGVY